MAGSEKCGQPNGNLDICSSRSQLHCQRRDSSRVLASAAGAAMRAQASAYF
jgi:hypothetical protein